MNLRTFYNQLVQALSRKGDFFSNLPITTSEEGFRKDRISFEIERNGMFNTPLTHIERVDRFIKKLDRFAESSLRIIKIIDDLAEQSNLVAMNASIEAARAGEAGKEFVLVADEIQTLAIRSSEATKEIRPLLVQSMEVTEGISELISYFSEKLQNNMKALEGTQGGFKPIEESTLTTRRLLTEMVASVEQGFQQGADLKSLVLSYYNKLMQENQIAFDKINQARISLQKLQTTTDEVGLHIG
jgi:methyl-accepting chemotaxis protein